MQKLIYYPSFEPPDKEWLKFALLYLEEFEPIVPLNRQQELSDEYKILINETDLIKPFSPDYSQGHRASLNTIKEAEYLLNSGDRPSSFNIVRLKEKWQNSKNWDFHVYEEKFSYDFIEFCKRHNIGKRTGDGLLLPEELAFMFMTQLAKEIAYDKDAAIITDNIRFDDYTNMSRTFSRSTQVRNRFAKGVVNLLIPQNLGEVDFRKLIKFRNVNRKLIRTFNTEIDNIQHLISNGLTEKVFIEKFNNIYSEISTAILLQGIGIASIPLAAYILIKNPQALAPEYIREIFGGIGVILGGTFELKKLWIDNKDKRYCKKYMANLKQLE
jgi:hypothetical protein